MTADEKLLGTTLLTLGGTFFLLYGSYLREDENIPLTAIQTAVGDVSAAFLAGLAVLPAVFALGIEPTSGPSLLFITLPGVFGAMPFGGVVGGLFFASFFALIFGLVRVSGALAAR